MMFEIAKDAFREAVRSSPEAPGSTSGNCMDFKSKPLGRGAEHQAVWQAAPLARIHREARRRVGSTELGCARRRDRS